MLHEDCNALIVESVSNNDDIALSPQQCNNVDIPYLPPTTHEDHKEITENSPKRIPDFCTCVVDKIISYK